MNKRKRRIEIVPVWRKPVDEKLLVLALLAYIDQLAEEERSTATDPDGEVARG